MQAVYCHSVHLNVVCRIQSSSINHRLRYIPVQNRCVRMEGQYVLLILQIQDKVRPVSAGLLLLQTGSEVLHNIHYKLFQYQVFLYILQFHLLRCIL